MKYYTKVLIVLIVILSGLSFTVISPQTVYANVYINEVFPNPSGDSNEPTEFIELFNSGESEVDLSGYKLIEAKEFLIEDVVLASGAYIAFDRITTSLALNNSGDSISLADSEGKVIDSFSFDNTVEDYSWSRYPDGTGEYYNSSVVTRGGPNVLPASPTPTPTPLPTLTSTPTKQINTPTITPSPTKVSLKTPTPTSGVTNPLSTPIDTDEEPAETTDTEQVLSVMNEANEDPREENSPEKSSKYGYASLFIIVGGLLFTAAGFAYFKTKE